MQTGPRKSTYKSDYLHLRSNVLVNRFDGLFLYRTTLNTVVDSLVPHGHPCTAFVLLDRLYRPVCGLE